MAIAPEKIAALPAHQEAEQSLLASAVNPQGDERPDNWQMGITAKGEFCGEAHAWNPCGTGGDRAKSDPGQNPETFDYQPFVLEAPISCSSSGWQEADYEGKALRFIKAATYKALEREFYTGEKIPTNLSLQGGTPNDDDHILNPGGFVAPQPVSAGDALLLLTTALANCSVGAKGMIHARPDIAEMWYQSFSLKTDDQGRLVTGVRGDIIVAGSGYTGQGPYGQPDPAEGYAWVYATGMVSVLVDDAEVFPKTLAEALDRQTNTVTFRGERTAAAYHDGCCSFAVLVDLNASVVPQEICDGPTPVARDYEICGGWTSIEDVGGPTLLLGARNITPAPASLTAQMSYAFPRGPIDGTPTFSDLPSTWVSVGIPPSPDPWVVLPLAFVPPDLHVPGWIRLTVTDENGCWTDAYAYFPNGIPETWDDGVTFYIAVSDLAFELIEVPAGPPDPMPGLDPDDYPLIKEVLGETGTCPVQPSAVPVTQACDDTWSVNVGVDPVDCDGTPALPVSVQCPDPLTVTLAEGEVPVSFHLLTSPDDSTSQFDDLLWARVVRQDSGLGTNDVKVWNQPSGSSWGLSIAAGSSFEIPVIPGQTFGLTVSVFNGASALVIYRR